MLYLLFFSTDAIANAGGTEIKYIDTQTGVELAGVGNILGAYITGATNANVGLVLFKSSTLSIVFYIIGVGSNKTLIFYNTVTNIRVFYF